MDEAKSKMDPKTKAIAILFLLLLVGAVIGLVVSKVSLDYIYQKATEKSIQINTASRPWQMYSDMLTLDTISICMNVLLLVGLLGLYFDSFRKTKSSFTLGLMAFFAVLVVQCTLSLPVLNVANSHQLSLISILPNIFELIALIILFYLSME